MNAVAPIATRIRRTANADSDISFGEVWDMCPFRTLLGRGRDVNEMLGRAACTIAVLGGSPEPLSPDMIAEALEAIAAGGVVILLAITAELRDCAKREILSLAGPVGGHA